MSQQESDQHISVLLEESVRGLNIQKKGIYIDATFGRGGHTMLILSQLDNDGRLIAFDKDPKAISVGQKLAEQDHRIEMIHASFATLYDAIERLNLVGKIDGILFDFGVSSPQLDDPERGFSFLKKGPLDMRMNNTVGISAKEWLHTASCDEMASVFKKYGEEKYAYPIAKKIIEHREKKLPLDTTVDLAQLVENMVPEYKRDKKKHPATRIFQAIRIVVNNELEDIEIALASAVKLLRSKGRLSVISFHSLEDRLVKRFFKKQSQGKVVPHDFPMTEAEINKDKILTMITKPIKPSILEIERNYRSRSSILRIAEKN